MKVRCISNTGESLRAFEYESLEKSNLGRFGATGYSEFGGVEPGKDYLVMGIIVFKTYTGYLLDDNDSISVYPCQLFEMIDDKVNSNWHFRLISSSENIYPFIQAIFGYCELCIDKKSYENLIVEKDEEAYRVYFNRKMEITNV